MSPRALRPQNVRRYCIFVLSHEAFGTDADYGTYTSLGMTVEKCKPSERMYRMVSLRKRVMATTLSVLLATSPLLGCAKSARNTSADSKEQEDLVKDDDQEKQGKTVPYSKQGEYTVTLQQGDFIQQDKDEATETQAPDAPDGKGQTAENEERAEEKKDLAFGDVKLEDVKVYYQVLVNRADVEADESGDVEPQYETR